MTQPSNDRRTFLGLGNGSNLTFAYDFYIGEDTHIQIIVRDTSGAETIQPTSAYGLTGVAIPPGGGNVMFVTAPASGYAVYAQGVEPAVQLFSATGRTFTDSAATAATFGGVEASLDRLVRILQQHDAILNRVIAHEKTGAEYGAPFTVRESSAANDSKVLYQESYASKKLNFGTPVVLDAVISSFMESLLDDTTATAARSTLAVEDYQSIVPFQVATGTAPVGYTLADISSQITVGAATHAVLRVQAAVNPSGVLGLCSVNLRNPTTPTKNYQVLAFDRYSEVADVHAERTTIVPLTSNTFEYNCGGAFATALFYEITLEGYYYR